MEFGLEMDFEIESIQWIVLQDDGNPCWLAIYFKGFEERIKSFEKNISNKGWITVCSDSICFPLFEDSFGKPMVFEFCSIVFFHFEHPLKTNGFENVSVSWAKSSYGKIQWNGLVFTKRFQYWSNRISEVWLCCLEMDVFDCESS